MGKPANALPLYVALLGIAGGAMMLPAIHAVAVDDFQTARAFFYSGLLTLILFSFIAVATRGTKMARPARSNLLALFGAFTVLPLVLALPFSNAVPDTTFFNATIEMLSSITTTGATLYDPERLPASVHLWRGLVGWLGGFIIWVSALAVLAPLNLGGFEIGARRQGSTNSFGPITHIADSAERMASFANRLGPIYAGLTGALWLSLFLAGEAPTIALIHAMSTLSTSGISPVGGLSGGQAGFAGELLVFLFLIFALSRVTFGPEDRIFGVSALRNDPEMRTGLLIIVTLPVILFARHYLGAAIFEDPDDITNGFAAFWGSLFTVASFLSTTGFESASWGDAQSWSGLRSPGILLMGLAVFGGGVATTAGGVKLMRVYVLFGHGRREIEKLVHPNS
ncbi:MAG: potassium transporter TrkG, partial [Pseudomonadota bacterium]